MPPIINEHVLDGVRAELLKYCDEETRSMSDILSHYSNDPFTQEYGEQEVKNLLYALNKSGFITSNGKAASVVYRTNEKGREVLPIFEASHKKLNED